MIAIKMCLVKDIGIVSRVSNIFALNDYKVNNAFFKSYLILVKLHKL